MDYSRLRSTASPRGPEVVVGVLGPERKKSPRLSGDDREGAAGTHADWPAHILCGWRHLPPYGHHLVTSTISRRSLFGPASHYLHCNKTMTHTCFKFVGFLKFLLSCQPTLNSVFKRPSLLLKSRLSLWDLADRPWPGQTVRRPHRTFPGPPPRGMALELAPWGVSSERAGTKPCSFLAPGWIMQELAVQ